MSEKKVPKRYSFVFRYPGIDLAREMMEHITAANTIFVKQPDKCTGAETTENNNKIRRRREYQDEAIMWMIETLETVNTSDFIQEEKDKPDKLAEKVIKEATLLKAWRDKYKVLNPVTGD